MSPPLLKRNKRKKKNRPGRFFFVSVRLSMAASGKGKFPAAGKAAEGVHQSIASHSRSCKRGQENFSHFGRSTKNPRRFWAK